MDKEPETDLEASVGRKNQFLVLRQTHFYSLEFRTEYFHLKKFSYRRLTIGQAYYQNAI